MSDYVDFIADPQRGCAIVAHRGAWHTAPENSLKAIENAIAAGYHIAEIDIRMSADGTLFLMHDATLERMADDPRVAEELTIAELAATRLRHAEGGPGSARTEERIPTLAEALETARGRIFLDLDLKRKELFPHVVDLVVDMGMAGQVDLKARVETQEARAWLGALDLRDIPFMAMARFTAETADKVIGIVEEMSPFMCETGFDGLPTIAERKHRFSAAGVSVWVNTLDPSCHDGFADSAALQDPDAIWGQLIEAGVSVIQTDEPQALKNYLKRRAG